MFLTNGKFDGKVGISMNVDFGSSINKGLDSGMAMICSASQWSPKWHTATIRYFDDGGNIISSWVGLTYLGTCLILGRSFRMQASRSFLAAHLI